ncbi:branched-chain amino acid aminotransferase 2, chloroplastic-like [Mercurialis annua]|uniref:branched-chain amino acid aminotransferase 2, chloroplastic-like n=1 Tax=Mercurialis annua TaxID=3986 RepID=UPI0024AD1AF7|nr:branched-chain amino acid aminotransferase 2, chloroplastic-like [Mercurialis annua]
MRRADMVNERKITIVNGNLDVLLLLVHLILWFNSTNSMMGFWGFVLNQNLGGYGGFDSVKRLAARCKRRGFRKRAPGGESVMMVMVEVEENHGGDLKRYCFDDKDEFYNELGQHGTFWCHISVLKPESTPILLEGLKAYRGEDKHIRLFRQEENAVRMQMGADRMCMPSPSIEQLVDAVKQVALANKRWIPSLGNGSLNIRPLLMGTGPVLGVRPAPECTFLLYASPVGNYSKGPLNLLVEEHIHRAMPGGTGGIKTITNYSPVYKASSEAMAKGFSDVLFLDAETGNYIEEGTACDVFVVEGNMISTPAISGTILSGITRKSIIEIALSFGWKNMLFRWRS